MLSKCKGIIIHSFNHVLYLLLSARHVLRMERKGIALRKLGSDHILNGEITAAAAAAAQRWGWPAQPWTKMHRRDGEKTA